MYNLLTASTSPPSSKGFVIPRSIAANLQFATMAFLDMVLFGALSNMISLFFSPHM